MTTLTFLVWLWLNLQCKVIHFWTLVTCNLYNIIDVSESYWTLNLHLQVGSVPFVVRALENTVALTVVSCCFAPRVIHFGIQITHNVLGTKYIESVESPSQRENITYSEELNSSPDCNLESSDVMDSSFTNNEIYLDSTENNKEEMCRVTVGTLTERFSFKQFQREVITHCLNGNDTIVIQPTGSGKSLCYQFPAIYTGKLAIVTSPTISLMMDQVKKLTEKGLLCTFHSTISK